jgi:excinuclease ABC subunit B
VVAEAIIRPTGLLDPIITLKPVKNQVDDILEQVRLRVENGERILITTLTKKFAEELDLYFKQLNIKSAYIHSDIETLDRLDILSDLRRGRYDVLIGINLLREGLDLPEVSLVAIFDADKEGFLRSRTSLVQIVGRAARHKKGEVIMYAETITDSMRNAIDETERRREIQIAYNKAHNITPRSTTRELKSIADDVREEVEKNADYGKSGATYTPNGWVENEKIESRFARPKKEPRSIHGDQKTHSRYAKAQQVYDTFDQQKALYLQELEALDLKPNELRERLQVAVDAMDFEMAAAIRDILNK